MAAAVPAVVVSGFLGSGKTTLVRHLLTDAQKRGVRVAVVSNEFGELGIDQALLGETGEAYVEIEGGCVCCKLSDELVATLQTVWERVRPDRIIIETSGVALPYDTQLNFAREPISSWVGDDVAIVVVNAEQLAAGRELEGTFEDQVSSADLLLLNKIDLVPESALATLEQQLGELAPGTPVLRSVQGEIDPAVLFAPDVLAREREREREPSSHEHESFLAEEIQIVDGVEPADLRDQLLAEQALRIKGFVHTSEGLRLVQGVGPRIELLPVDAPPPGELIGRLVLIRRRD
jgi:cobalamin biosynthesis protein CobW